MAQDADFKARIIDALAKIEHRLETIEEKEKEDDNVSFEGSAQGTARNPAITTSVDGIQPRQRLIEIMRHIQDGGGPAWAKHEAEAWAAALATESEEDFLNVVNSRAQVLARGIFTGNWASAPLERLRILGALDANDVQIALARAAPSQAAQSRPGRDVQRGQQRRPTPNVNQQPQRQPTSNGVVRRTGGINPQMGPPGRRA